MYLLKSFCGLGFLLIGLAGCTYTSDKALVKMFKDSDPNGAATISARETLGSDWAAIVKKPPATC